MTTVLNTPPEHHIQSSCIRTHIQFRAHFLYTVRPLLSAPLLSAPLLSVPLLSAPLISAPLLSAPLLSAPLLSAPLLSAPLLSAPLLSAPLLSAELDYQRFLRPNIRTSNLYEIQSDLYDSRLYYPRTSFTRGFLDQNLVRPSTAGNRGLTVVPRSWFQAECPTYKPVKTARTSIREKPKVKETVGCCF